MNGNTQSRARQIRGEELILLGFPELAEHFDAKRNERRPTEMQPASGEVEQSPVQPRPTQDIVLVPGEFGKLGQSFLRASPLPIDWGENPRQDAIALLQALFLPYEYVFAAWGAKEDGVLNITVRTRREWELHLQVCPHLPCVFLPNPVKGFPSQTKQGGKWSFRCNKSILAFRHAVVEFPAIPEGQQFLHWSRFDLSHLSALVSTGVGTLQGFIRVDAQDEKTWKEEYEQKWLPLGCKRRCAIPANLARLAGGQRALVTKEFCRTHLSESVPPMIPQRLWYVRPELTVGGAR